MTGLSEFRLNITRCGLHFFYIGDSAASRAVAKLTVVRRQLSDSHVGRPRGAMREIAALTHLNMAIATSLARNNEELFMIEHDVESLQSTDRFSPNNIAEVVVGECATLNATSLSHDAFMRLLLHLLVRAKEITSVLYKECLYRNAFEDDCSEYRHLYMAYRNVSLAVGQIVNLKVREHESLSDPKASELYRKKCISNLYMSLNYIGKFLHTKTKMSQIDLSYWRAEQVLALTVNAASVLHLDYMPHRNKNEHTYQSEFSLKATKILEVANRAINRVKQKRISVFSNVNVIFRNVAVLNILNRLVVNTEFFESHLLEANLVLDLVVKRRVALNAQLSTLMELDPADKENVLLCKIAASMLLYYQIVVHHALSFLFHVRPCHKNSSLAFSLIKNLSLALEAGIALSCDTGNTPSNSQVVTENTLRKVSHTCNGIYNAIVFYHLQLKVQDVAKQSSELFYHNACLDCIENALMTVRNVIPQALCYGTTITHHLQMLEESLAESATLCASTLQQEEASSKKAPPSQRLSSDISVVTCFMTTPFRRNTQPYVVRCHR